MQVSIVDAKNRLSELIKSAQAGEDVVIANRGKPAVRLVPADPAPEGAAGNIVEWLRRNPLPAHARRSPEELQASVREEREAWD